MSDKDKIRQEIERRKGYSSVTHFAEELDSLPEEKPSEDLEEAANDYCSLYYDWDNEQERKSVVATFIAGAKWQAKQLLKGSPLPEDTVLFQKGVEEGKRLIMEDAVDGEIGYWNQSGLSIRLDQSLEKLGYDMDTKVKIIIVKEDDGLHKAEAE